MIPPKTFVVTFDDGFENVYQHAWPILRGLGIPATIFLATQYLDAPEPFPFDDWELAGSMAVAPDSWRPLSTAQCAEMHADGLIDIGSHTHAHEDFRGRPSAFSRDLALSLEVLRARLGLTKVPFAFPSGLTSQELISAAKQAGLLCGLNTQGIPVDHRSDPFTWGRFTSTETDTVGDLAAKLNGWYTFMRSAWRRLKYFPSDGVVADSDPASDTDGVASPRLDLKRSGMDSRECH